MAAEEYKLIKYCAIVFFAACVVALGAKELQKQHVPRIKPQRGVEARTKNDLIKDLHGASVTEEIRELKAAEENGTLSDRKPKEAAKADEAESSDSVTSGDRRLLKGLVDKLSWEEEKK